MKLFKKTKNTSQERSSSNNTQNQRVYTYYTASKSQIDKFERSNKTRSDKKTDSISVRLFGSKIVAVLVVIVLVIGLGFGLTALAGPAVIFKENTRYQSNEAYNQQISGIVKSDMRNLFKPTLQSTAIEAEIKQIIPEATSVDAYAPIIGRGIVVNITTAKPFAVLIQKSGPSFIIDQTGKAVTDISTANLDTTNLSTITNDSLVNFNIGDQVFKPEEMQGLADLNYQLTQGQSKPISYKLPEVPREIRLDRAGYFVKFSLDDSSGADTKRQYGAMVSIEKSIEQQGIAVPTQYIDVRLGDKVYIK